MESIIKNDILDALVAEAEHVPQGCMVEVGVYKGGSAARLYDVARRQGRVLHLFDTFSGMPLADPDDYHRIGDFADGIDLPALRAFMPEAVFHVGVFPETMPAGLDGIAFAHIDCDQYRSVLACIDTLWCRMVPGGVMWFDDYGALKEAKRAVLERFSESDLIASIDGRVFTRHP